MSRGARFALAVAAVLVVAGAGLGIHAWMRANDDPRYDEWEALAESLGLPAAPGVTLPETAVGLPFEPVPERLKERPLSFAALADQVRADHPQGAVPWAATVLTVSKTSLHLDLGDLTLPIPPDGDRFGLEGKFKRGSRNELFIVPLGQTLSWVKGRWRKLAGTGADDAPLVILADRGVPYRVLTEVLYTAGQCEFGRFDLVGQKAGERVAMESRPPRPGQVRGTAVELGGLIGSVGGVGKVQRPPAKPSLGLNVMVVDEGFVLSALGQRIGPGCEGTGAGIAVPKRADPAADYDYAGLTACLRRIKDKVPDAPDERTATLSANPRMPYDVVRRTMAALARDEQGKELFPEVLFGVAR